MFEIGWTEMLVIAVVMIVVVGPKDLPKMLRSFGRTTTTLRRMAGDFRKQFDEALKEADLDDVKSTIDSARKLNPVADIRKALNPMEQAAADVRAGLDTLVKPQPPKVPSPSASAEAAEPLKAGAAAVPGETAPAAAVAPAPAAPPPVPAATAPVATAAAAPVGVASAMAPATQPGNGADQAAAVKRVRATPRKRAAAKTSGAES